MKNALLLVALIVCGFAYSQDFGISKKDSCYFRYDQNGKRMITQDDFRYAEWECGKLAGVIDCHQELSYEEGSNTVIRISSDNTNLHGVGKPFTGMCESCHMNGVLERRVNFVDGKEHGLDTTYYTTGCIQVIRSIKNGQDDGTWYYHYDSTAILAWEMNFLLGEKHGKHIYFTEDADTTKWENYKYGKLDGVKRVYYSDSSKIRKVINYKDGYFDGKFVVYNRETVIVEDLEYKMGKKHKECKYYYDDGTLMKIENWNEGLRNGEFKSLYYEQIVMTLESYKDDVAHGLWEEYHPDGQKKSEKTYKKGKLLTEYRFDEHGRETFAFPPREQEEDEDDDAPTGKKKKKKKKKNKENVTVQ